MAASTTTPLLYTRFQASKLLGCSVSTIIRLEKEGSLRGFRLGARQTGQIYHRQDEIMRLIDRRSNQQPE